MAQTEDPTFATLTIDGADSNKTKVPQHWTKNVRTEYDDNSIVEQRVMTVLLHGQNLLHFYVFAPNVAKGMDCVVSCIVDSLRFIPPSVEKLRIQVDGEKYEVMSSDSLHNMQSQCNAGSSENVNYALHTLCGLLTTYGLLKEIYIARLPVGHTHIDIDGRHAIFSMHFNGTKDSGGRVGQGIMTPAEFDREIKVPYKSDKVTVFRKYGLLAFADRVKGWLGFSNYGTPSKSSAHAKAQGGRDPEAHFFTYFRDSTMGISRMRYKFLETDSLSMPSADGIVVIKPEHQQDALDLLHDLIPMKELEEWTNRVSVESSISGNKDLSPFQLRQWEEWFSSCPVTIADIDCTDDGSIIRWRVSDLLSKKKEYFEALQAAYTPWKAQSHRVQQFPHEIIVHPGHPKKTMISERKERQHNYQRQLNVEAEGKVVAAFLDAQKKASKRKRFVPPQCKNCHYLKRLTVNIIRKKKISEGLDECRGESEDDEPFESDPSESEVPDARLDDSA